MGLSDYFDLRKSFPFYGAYHHDWWNQWIHIFGVPCIAATTLCFLHRVPLPISGGWTLADLTTLFYVTSFIAMDFVAGLAYAPILIFMNYLGAGYLTANVEFAVALHVAAWISQFVGHGVFEGRKPALMDNLLQALHAAVFFVWLEVLFKLGYKPALKKELDALTVKEMRKFAAKRA